MNKQKFVELLRTPEKMSKTDLSELEALTVENPYFQSGHMAIARGSRFLRSPTSGKKISTAAIYATNRENLKKYMLGKAAMGHVAPPTQKKVQTSVAPKRATPQAQSSKGQQTASSPRKAPQLMSKTDHDVLIDEIYSNLNKWKKSRDYYLEYEKQTEEEPQLSTEVENIDDAVEKIKNQIAEEVIAEDKLVNDQLEKIEDSRTSKQVKEEVSPEIKEERRVEEKAKPEIDIESVESKMSGEAFLRSKRTNLDDEEKPAEKQENTTSGPDNVKADINEVESIDFDMEISLLDDNDKEQVETPRENVKEDTNKLPSFEIEDQPSIKLDEEKKSFIPKEVETNTETTAIPTIEIDDQPSLTIGEDSVIESKDTSEDASISESQEVVSQMPTIEIDDQPSVELDEENEQGGLDAKIDIVSAPAVEVQEEDKKEKEPTIEQMPDLQIVEEPVVVNTPEQSVVDDNIDLSNNAETTKLIDDEIDELNQTPPSLEIKPSESVSANIEKSEEVEKPEVEGLGSDEELDSLNKEKHALHLTPSAAKSGKKFRLSVLNRSKRTKPKASLRAEMSGQLTPKVEAEKAESNKEDEESEDSESKEKIKLNTETPSKSTNSKLEAQKNIINSFLEQNPSIVVNKQDAGEQNKDLSVMSGSFPDEVVTENLAQILEKQGKTQLAISVLNKLIRLQPEKKSQFEAQIQKLETSHSQLSEDLINESEEDILSRFIEENPTIFVFKWSDLVEIAIEFSKDISSMAENQVTESLAKVFVHEQKYNEAILIYERLSLIYPKKMAYFASQIEKLNTK